MKWVKRLLHVLVPLLIIGAGVLGARYYITTRPAPDRQPRAEMEAAVTFVPLVPTDETILLEAQGVVRPARQLELRAEVGGRIEWIHPDLEPGGHIAAGEVLARIDARDYENAVRQAQARVAGAEVERQIETARGAVAAREWALLEEGLASDAAGRALALREPQAQAAAASLEGARAALADAELRLERTAIRAPFDVIVLTRDTEIGQIVGAQSRLAQLAGRETAWIEATLPARLLPWFARCPKDAHGTVPATVWYDTGLDQTITRTGAVVRLLADLEDVGRLARVLVAVSNPLCPAEAGPGPLPFNAYVRVGIHGPKLPGLLSIPREYVHEGNRIWIANDADRLEVRKIEILWRDRERILVADGAQAGERLITSRLPLPIPGLKLRPRPAGDAP